VPDATTPDTSQLERKFFPNKPTQTIVPNACNAKYETQKQKLISKPNYLSTFENYQTIIKHH